MCHLFGVSINTNKSDKENGLCFYLEIIEEDTWSFLPNRSAYDEHAGMKTKYIRELESILGIN